jgi:predicted SnoaL-like aldol condensation-catalyzing enzyme
MQRLLLPVLAACCLLASCNTSSTSGSPGSDSTQQKNLKANRDIMRAFTSGDVSIIDSTVAPDLIDHAGPNGPLKGRDTLKAMITQMHASKNEMKMETVQEAASGDYVFAWVHFSGTSDGSMGMPPGPYDMHAVEVSKFKDGMATEHWEFMDEQEMMKMMKPPAGGGAPMPADSSKMKK